MRLRTAFEPRAFRDFWTLSLGQFLVFVGFFAFFQFPLYIKDLGGGEKEVGVIMGVISLASALLIPWITGIVERTERKQVMLFGVVVLEGATLLCMTTTAPDVWMGFLMLLRGFGFAVFMNAAGVYVASVLPPGERSKWIGVNFGFNQLAIGIGPYLGELMIREVGYLYYFVMSGVIVYAGMLLVLAITPRSPEGPTVPLRGLATAVRFYKAVGGVRYRQQIAGLLLVASALGAVFNFTAIYVQSIGLTSGLFFVFYSTMNVLCRFFGGGLSDRYGRLIVIVPNLLIFALGVLLYRYTNGLTLLAFSAGLIGVGFGLSNPAILAMVLDRSTPAEQGLAIGTFNFAYQAGMVGTTPIFGLIASRWGYGPMWLIATGCIVAATAVFLLPAPRLPSSGSTAAP